MPDNVVLSPDLKVQVFLDLSRRISRTLDLREILEHLLESVQATVPYDAAGVFVLNRSVPLVDDPGPDLIAGMVTRGFNVKPTASDPMLRSGHGIVGHVIRTGETVLAGDVERDPRYVVGRDTTRSELAVPIVSNLEVIGALDIESDTSDAFSPRDAELLEFFASAAALSIEKALLHREVLAKQRIEGQLAIARDVQSGLLPSAPPVVPGYDIAATHLPTWAIGGDYYDYVPLGDGRLGLVIADVSGKGIPAALIMASFRAALRTVVWHGTDEAHVVDELNRFLLDSGDLARFVTAVYGVLDPRAGSFRFVNCGHNPPLLLRGKGGREFLEAGGPPLGILEKGMFRAARVDLAPGDTLILFTDGVVELTDAGGLEFGVDRIEAIVRSNAERPAKQLVRAVIDATRAFSGRDRYDDDFTLVVVKRHGNGNRSI